MKREIKHPRVLKSISSIFDQTTDEAGYGIVGFTLHFSDSVFENVIYPYSRENKAQVLVSLTNLRQSYLLKLPSIQMSNQTNTITKGKKQKEIV
jgi:hypothetical protein